MSAIVLMVCFSFSLIFSPPLSVCCGCFTNLVRL
nr:MAG TPA: hypothetical protein [Caudoviricetes sp.]